MRPTVPRRWPAPRPRSGRRRRGLMGGGGGGGGGVAHGLSDFTNQSPALPALFTLPAISSISTPWGAAMGALLFPSLPSCPFLCRSPRHAASPCPCSPWCALHRPVRKPARWRWPAAPCRPVRRHRNRRRPPRLPHPPHPPRQSRPTCAPRPGCKRKSRRRCSPNCRFSSRAIASAARPICTRSSQTLQLQVETFQGFFDDVRYRFLATQAHGTATRVDFLDRDRSVVHNATYTTCERRDLASQPDWLLRAATLHIDEAQQVGSADDAVLEFKGWPLLPIPHISFPLSDKRKSGLLPPTVGLDRRDGLSYSQPYYWNIAPNRDATLNAALMTERGASLGLEWRYLEPSYHGQINTDLMPYDRLRQRSRWSLSGQHQGRWDAGIGALGLSLGIYRVSDDNYWRDFSRVATSLRQRLLPADAVLSWARNDMSATLRTLQWQTLQDVTAPIVPPYDRMPQLQWRYAPTRLGGGLDASLELDATRFEAARALTGQPNANRSYALAQISRPFLAPQGFITPRLQWHATRYQFPAPLG